MRNHNEQNVPYSNIFGIVEHLIDCYEGVGEDYLGDAAVAEGDQVNTSILIY